MAEPAAELDVGRLVEAADQALYDAKTAGRDQVRSRLATAPGGG